MGKKNDEKYKVGEMKRESKEEQNQERSKKRQIGSVDR